ncbi:hypothetical protein IRY61_02170, partial [Candidatus Saccharibacteria bacterium]|nr:hypothetical protein [Candidatus Saccharibacteria bacterium]
MQPQDPNTTVMPSDSSESQSPPSLAVAPEPVDPGALSYDPMNPGGIDVVAMPSKSSRYRRILKLFFRWSAIALLVLAVLGSGAFLAWSSRREVANIETVNPASSFDTQTIPLDSLAAGAIDPVFTARQVAVNGQLRVGEGLIITPSLQPSAPQPGQLYYDQRTNLLGYFNGTEFVFLDTNETTLQPSTPDVLQPGSVVEQIGGMTGQVSLGAGLGAVAGQLVNTGVLSVQGQTGAVTLIGGNGIAINGTTITNTGVISVQSANPAVVVTDDGNGNITLDFIGGGAGTVASPGGTAGRIAKFTAAQVIADSLLSESGTTITVNGNLTVTGTTSLGSPLSVSNGGTGTTSLAANGVLVGNGVGAITSIVAGASGLCLVSTGGAPTWANCTSPTNAVQSLNGLTGNITIANATGLVDTITIDDASTSNKGIAQFNGMNFSVSGGIVNTIQNISTGSSPTFNSLTLSGNLTVQGGTSTLGTLTQAGSLVLSDGSSNTVTIVADNLSGNRTYRLPDAGGDAVLCVTTGNCIGGTGSAPNTAPYLVATLDGTLTNERVLTGGSNITLTDGGANGPLTVATVQDPAFSTSVTTPILQSSGALVVSSAAGNTVAIDAGTTIELQDSTNVTGTLSVTVALNVGAGNAFSVDSSGVITAAAGITSSGAIIFTDLDCTTYANGGALTTDGSGQLICSDDDGGAGSGITGTGTNGTIPVFTGSNTIANSIITQSGTTITVAGDLVLGAPLAVSSGGTGATSFTTNGVLYGNGTGALQVTAAGVGGQVLIADASGVPTFVSFSGDVTVSSTGVVTIQPNSVALGTDTTGDYVANLGTLTGLGVSGNSGEGSTPNLSVLYGSVAGTAVQGNVTLTCPAGTGNLTGGGDSITLGAGGACGSINTVDDPTFATSVTTPNLILTGTGNSGSIVVGNLGQNTIYTLPDPGQAAVDICLSIGNCTVAGTAGGDLTGTYPNPTIAKLQGTNLSIVGPVGGNVLVYNASNSQWENVAISGDVAISETGVVTIQANSVALGTDTTGNYVIGLSAGNGIDITGTPGEGWTPTIAVLYGSIANTAVEGDTQIAVTAGTNMTGGGTITLGAGGSVTLNVADSPTFAGTLTVQGGTVAVGTTTQQGVVVLHDGAGQTGSIQIDPLGQNVVYTLPDPGQATAEICLTTGNCAGIGGGVTTAGGTTNRLAKFTGSQAIGDSLLSDDGSTVTITGSGNFVVQGGTATLGTLTQAGTLTVHDGSGNAISIVATSLSGSYQFTLPDTGGNATFCMSTGNCIGSGGGGAPSDASYLVLGLSGDLNNERVLTNGSNISLTDGGANGTLTIATVQDPTFSTSVTTPMLQSSGALAISSGGSDSVIITAGTTIELQSNTNVNGVLDVAVSLSVGAGNAFSVDSSGVITAAAGITSSGAIIFTDLDCTTYANGGALTTDGSGQLVCSDDDGGDADGITGTGTNGTIAMFTGVNTIANSIITQSGSTVTITGSLTLTNALSVSSGGTGASSFTPNGVLYGNGTGALQVTVAGTGGQVLIANASGVPTFVSFSGDVAVSDTGVVTIQANSVALGTDTTGNYVEGVTAGNGISISGTPGEGWTPTISVVYGSTANTAVQGNVTLTCPVGTGNLTGGGDSITLGTGGTCGALNAVNDPTFGTSVTTPNLILTGSGSNGSLQVATLGQPTTFI